MSSRDLNHGRRYWWCGRTDPHTHTEQLNGPHLVDGRPAGPWVLGMRSSARGWGKEAAMRHLLEVAGHQPTAIPGPPPGWTGCGSPEATVARIAHPPAWPHREPPSAIVRAIRDALVADLARLR